MNDNIELIRAAVEKINNETANKSLSFESLDLPIEEGTNSFEEAIEFT